ncbi:disulfide bond formation protein DsbA [Microbulbifer agarilyticus]|uniref:Disulfide bond formation protein DsbA n=1 Tax=Microbulbifer agarilyticus TaxID=260552 RepID=A0A1Q2M216_9GAMM|nr:DsbA family oxidoreductase [Microbulbifer agarilyticus]AQQ66317.1 disulfide bond formation protein DsbA [Microbulbifer agarilyticus]
MQKLPLRIDIVSDVVCPWCVIGYYRLQQALDNFDQAIDPTINWLPFELNPDMPSEGQNLREHIAEKYGTSPEESIAARERLTKLGADVGFPFDYFDEMRMVNTFHAHQLLHWAVSEGKQHALSLQLFADFFSHRRDVSAFDILIAAAESVGLNSFAARDVLAQQTYANDVRQLEQGIASKGVRGVPLFVFNAQYALSGAQEVTTFEAQLQRIIDDKHTA